MESIVIWVITQFTLNKSKHFEGKYSFHYQGRRLNEAINHQEAGYKLVVSRIRLAAFELRDIKTEKTAHARNKLI
jgi:hypothetical protein